MTAEIELHLLISSCNQFVLKKLNRYIEKIK